MQQISDDLTITRAGEADIPEVADFEREYFDVGEPYSLADYERLFGIGDVFRMVHSTRGLVGASVQAYGPNAHKRILVPRNNAYFAGVVMHPEFRRGGNARHLLRAGEDRAAAMGVENIMVCIRANNVHSLKLFTRQDYRVIDGRVDVMPVNLPTQDQGHRLILGKELQPKFEETTHRTEEIEVRLRETDERSVCELLHTFRGRILSCSISKDDKLCFTVQNVCYWLLKAPECTFCT